MATTTESVKEQVVDTIPKRIRELKFGIGWVSFVVRLNGADERSVLPRISLSKACLKYATEISTTCLEIERLQKMVPLI